MHPFVPPVICGFMALAVTAWTGPALAAPPACPTISELDCDALVAGELDAGAACALVINGRDDGSVFDRYELRLTEDKPVTITLTSADFDAFLYLYDADGDELAFDDDSGGGTNARVTAVLEAAGAYRLDVNGFFAGGVGAYSLSVTCGDRLPVVFTNGFEAQGD